MEREHTHWLPTGFLRLTHCHKTPDEMGGLLSVSSRTHWQIICSLERVEETRAERYEQERGSKQKPCKIINPSKLIAQEQRLQSSESDALFFFSVLWKISIYLCIPLYAHVYNVKCTGDITDHKPPYSSVFWEPVRGHHGRRTHHFKWGLISRRMVWKQFERLSGENQLQTLVPGTICFSSRGAIKTHSHKNRALKSPSGKHPEREKENPLKKKKKGSRVTPRNHE